MCNGHSLEDSWHWEGRCCCRLRLWNRSIAAVLENALIFNIWGWKGESMGECVSAGGRRRAFLGGHLCLDNLHGNLLVLALSPPQTHMHQAERRVDTNSECGSSIESCVCGGGLCVCACLCVFVCVYVHALMCLWLWCLSACVRACGRACMRACMRACVRVCMHGQCGELIFDNAGPSVSRFLLLCLSLSLSHSLSLHQLALPSFRVSSFD